MKNVFTTLIFLLSIRILLIETVMAQNRTIPVKVVGVVLDFDDWVGDIRLRCINKSYSDFHANHSHYKAGLVLHYKDSNRYAFGAAAAALDLIKSMEVQEMAEPSTLMQVSVHGEKDRVPIVSISVINSSYLFQAVQTYLNQAEAIKAMIQEFGWKQAVPLYVENVFRQAMVPHVTSSLHRVSGIITDVKEGEFSGSMEEEILYCGDPDDTVDARQNVTSDSTTVLEGSDNVNDDGATEVGFPKPRKGLVEELNSLYDNFSTSFDPEPVLRSRDSSVLKGWETPRTTKRMIIGLPKKNDSRHLVNFEDQESRKTWTFLKHFTWEIWMTSICIFLFIGSEIWVVQRVNEDFQEPLSHQAATSFTFWANKHLEWIFILTNMVLEAVLVVLDQIACPQKPQYALTAFVVSLVAMAVFVLEISLKARKQRVVLKRQGMRFWFEYPSPSDKPFYSFLDVFLFICALCQCIFWATAYSYHRRHANSPTNIYIVSLVFVICLAFSKLTKDPKETPV